MFYYYSFQSWDSFFRNASAGAEPGQAYQAPPSLATPGKYEVPITSLVPHFGTHSAPATFSADEKVVDDHLAVQAIIRSYQVFIRCLFFRFVFICSVKPRAVVPDTDCTLFHFILYFFFVVGRLLTFDRRSEDILGLLWIP